MTQANERVDFIDLRELSIKQLRALAAWLMAVSPESADAALCVVAADLLETHGPA